MDEEIEAREGRPCAELVAEDEPRFRRLEEALLEELIEQRTDAIIAAGGGLRTHPSAPLVVWLSRDGWADTARDERQRLRPELEWEEEVEWMRTTRESRWAAAAHVHYEVSRGRTAGWAARDIATLIEWCDRCPASGFAARTWVVPSRPGQLVRSLAMARGLGLAGVEVRSDICETFPELKTPTLASIRTDDPDWLAVATRHANAFDLDIEFYQHAIQHGLFTAEPRRLLVSSHSGRCDPEDVQQLVRIAREIQERYPRWAGQVELKYAPVASTFGEAGLARAMVAPLRRAGMSVTLLPQGHPLAGLRPLLLEENTTNYVSATMRPSRVSCATQPTLTPMDLQDWLPHITDAPPETWDVLIGDPAVGSQGDVWHRRAAFEEGDRHCGYAKVRVPLRQFDAALDLLSELDVRGVSVTSPLKRRVHFLCPDDAEFGQLLDEETAATLEHQGAPMRTGNTLVRVDQAWVATDTDTAGMTATLEHLEARGYGPGTLAIFGRGGVSAALLRAIDQSDWFLAFHAGAREGWGEDAPRRVDVVVDASGGHGDVETGAPNARAWVDLRYRDVPDPPGEPELLGGDVFFEGQARLQRDFWKARSG